MARANVRVGLLWRAEWDPVEQPADVRESCRLRAMFAAFDTLGVSAEPVVYSDDSIETVRAELLELDGVLVWVNPIQDGLDRSRLDPLLREAAEHGVWVSAHPDVIVRLATKEVLVDTEEMSWGAPTHLYRSADQLRSELPARLGARALVLKQRWGMGGEGVWKVERGAGGELRVLHAASAGTPENIALEAFVERCSPYFEGGGLMVEQPFQPRLAEGMIRVYMCHDAVVGFAHQYPRGLLDPDIAATLPTEKTFEPPSEARFQPLRERMEQQWVGELQQIVGVERDRLPVIWDVDFLHGDGEDDYVLCEINASSTFAFPEHAMPTVARAALERIATRRA